MLSASPVLLMHCDQHDVHVHVHNDYFEAAGHNVTGHGEEARGQARLSIGNNSLSLQIFTEVNLMI